MSINNQNTYLNIEDAHLRLRTGNVYAQGINIGGITVDPAHGLQRVSDTGNVTSNTLQFANATTAFVTTANVTVGRDLTVTGNATVSSNLTVTGNAVISDDLTVTENLLVSNNLTVTGNTFYTNPASVLVDSNVVTEYTGPHDRPLRKYPEVNFLGDGDLTQFGYTASSSGQFSATYPASNAFTGTATTTQNAWVSLMSTFETTQTNNGSIANSSNVFTGAPSGEQNGPWLKIELPKAIKLSHSKIYRWHASAYNTRLKDGYIYGSNDDSTYTRLVRLNNLGTSWDQYTGATINVNATEHYKYYVLHVREIYQTDNTSAANSPYVTLGEWELYGHEEGSGSLDTTLKSVYNVPATTGTQLEVYYDAKDLTTMPSTVTDLAGGDQNGTVTGHSPTLDNNSFVFDGVDDYITTTLTNPNTDWVHSASMWVYPTDISDDSVNGYIFAIGPEVSNQVSALRFRPDGFNYTRWQNGGAKIFNGPVTSGRWHHVTLVSPGSTDVQVYLDGRLLGYTSDSLAALTLPQNTSLSVGRFAASASYSRPFNGSIANFRLYSKALNAGQVQELYDYQKDYFLGSKSQVTLYKGHLGVGVTEPSGQLELAGDERIQAYPPRGMTDFDTYIEGHGVFTASASSVFSSGENRQAYQAFNGGTDVVTDDAWISKNDRYTSGLPNANAALINGVAGEWLGIQFPYPIKLKQIAIQNRAGAYNNRSPDSGILWGSNDGTEYKQVVSWNGLVFAQSSSQPSYVTINATNTYRFFRLQTTKLVTTASDFVAIGELKLFGTPGPTTLDKGSLTLGRSLDVPRVSRYDVDTETPRPEKLVVDFDTTVNSSPTDISGQGNHGTFNGGASYSPADKAFVFDGTGDYIQASGVTLPTAHSMSVWFNMDSDQSGINSIMHIGTFNTEDESRIFTHSNLLHATIYGSTIQYATSLSPGSWYHVVYTFTDGTTFNTTNAKIYVNGQLVSTTQTQTAATLNLVGNTVTIGATSSGAEAFKGKISNPKLYSVILEPSEVRKLYNLGRTGRSMVISDTAVGIGKVPEAQLDVRGNLNVDGVLTNQQRPAFYVWRDDTSGTTPYKNTTGVITNWDSKRIDTAGTFDLSNGRYYIPVSGLYNFVGAGLYRYGGSGNGILEVSFYVNGSNVNVRGISYNRGNTTNEHQTVTITFMRFMNAGDYVQMGIFDCQTACDLYYGDGLGYFSGYLLG